VAKLSIPERYRPGIFDIARLDDESVRKIRAALDGATSGYRPDAPARPSEVAIDAITSVSGMSSSDSKKIAEALAALYRVRAARDASVEDFAEDVCNAMASVDVGTFRIQPSERDSLKRRLLTLLNADLFGLVTKVHDLATDDERVFCGARILTDLRPVFGSNVEDGPRAMLVVHLLKLGYHRGPEKHQEFYVSLDSDDLQSLRNVIERAEAKAKALRSTTEAGNTRLFGAAKE
jgi:hypothetical protein